MTAESKTSEELHGISKQPQPSCPMVDDCLQTVREALSHIKGYERASEEELRGMCEKVEYWIGDLDGRSGMIEDLREANKDIREWGEEWKRTALKYFNQLPPETE